MYSNFMVQLVEVLSEDLDNDFVYTFVSETPI